MNPSEMKNFWTLALFSTLSIVGSTAQLVAGSGCCTQFSICGQTYVYCAATGCQSQCTTTGGGGAPSTTTTTTGGNYNISSLISRTHFNQMLKHKDDEICPGRGFYTYDAFIAAAKSFNGFGTTGDMDTRKREIAAFFAQTSHETNGGWSSAPDGPYAWGYCYVREQFNSVYCDKSSSAKWSCAPGKLYIGRGPFQLTYNFNYGQAGQALGLDLLNNPDLVATDATISFKTALWFWTTPVVS